jgi:hypothetical protein
MTGDGYSEDLSNLKILQNIPPLHQVISTVQFVISRCSYESPRLRNKTERNSGYFNHMKKYSWEPMKNIQGAVNQLITFFIGSNRPRKYSADGQKTRACLASGVLNRDS